MVVSGKGSRFLRCGRSDADESFARYPPLPVTACRGFEAPAAPRRTARRPASSVLDGAVPDDELITFVETPPPPGGGPRAGGPTLFERAGGRAAVERIVERFYDRIERDPELRPLFPADLAAGLEKQRLFLEQWLGGEERYSQRYGHPRLRRRHFPFVISERAAGRWLRHMAEALREAGVPEDARAEMLAGLRPLAHHMVNEGQDVPRAPLDSERLD
ncbi:MAG: hypothetical protein EXR65_02415 [Dehalococcoidia bacterium]|nr:hypothetical protein [Dehalococcoidia bacterium]